MYTHALLEIIEKCDKNCSYCFRPRKSSTAMSKDDFSKTLKFLKENNVFQICFTGGEPLLHENLFLFLQYSTLHGFFTTVNTSPKNLVQWDLVKKISQLARINVSFETDGCNHHSHRRLSKQNLKNVYELSNKKLSLSIVVGNVSESDIRFLIELNLRGYTFDISPLINENMNKTIQGLKTLYTHKIIMKSDFDVWLSKINKENIEEKHICNSRKLYIQSDGRIGKCPYRAIYNFSSHSNIEKLLRNDTPTGNEHELGCITFCN